MSDFFFGFCQELQVTAGWLGVVCAYVSVFPVSCLPFIGIARPLCCKKPVVLNLRSPYLERVFSLNARLTRLCALRPVLDSPLLSLPWPALILSSSLQCLLCLHFIYYFLQVGSCLRIC